MLRRLTAGRPLTTPAVRAVVEDHGLGYTLCTAQRQHDYTISRGLCSDRAAEYIIALFAGQKSALQSRVWPGRVSSRRFYWPALVNDSGEQPGFPGSSQNYREFCPHAHLRIRLLRLRQGVREAGTPVLAGAGVPRLPQYRPAQEVVGLFCAKRFVCRHRRASRTLWQLRSP